MTTKAHKLLTGADLHEPKGVESASVGQVYVSDGLGSGAWVTINTEVGFSTGDVKYTLKNVADTGWILSTHNTDTIGSAASGATFARDDAESLFKLIWNRVSNTYAPVTGGRGGSADIDWAANKKIAVLALSGRAIAGVDSDAGSVAGQYVGSATHSITQAELPNVSPTFSGTLDTVSVQSLDAEWGRSPRSSSTGGGAFEIGVVNTTGSFIGSAGTFRPRGTISALGSGTAMSLLQPTVYLNVMIKL